jgi:hypothetical protein
MGSGVRRVWLIVAISIAVFFAGLRPREWMLLLLSSAFGRVDLVEHFMCFLLEFGVAAGSDFKSA